MFWVKILLVALTLNLATCEPPASSYGVPLNSYVNNAAGNGYNNNNHHDHHDGQDPDHSEPKSYEFGYAVKDDYSGNDYKRRETSDGNQVTGEYRVQLPDGRTQIVSYYADWQTGFHADVRYEGTASYPDQYNSGNNGNNYHNPSNQYGTPNYNNGGNQPNSQYGTPFNGNNNQGYNGNQNRASSSVTIKDFSGPSTPYKAHGNEYNNNNGYSSNNQYPHNADNFGAQNYDSYNNGNFGSRSKPYTAYGAP